MPVLEEIIAEVRALPQVEQQRLREILNAEASRFDPAQRIRELVAEQGTRPLNFDEMLGDFWPEEESMDEFLATLREWRSEGEHRSVES
ncbi:MAG TPA: hypothetical protein VFZ34_25610 [Blastocatellia bacterium]|nr:hypothetical protein [Blastocatellia bacterium]